ncbi:hypothetical protein LCGC14_0275490 [marine sediment metagenome]|uniref:Uncharacterized protein n=1 Tax=marine sediment metagenome TaxID=412755 RepID=A0A0F9U2E3_9ZZZZ
MAESLLPSPEDREKLLREQKISMDDIAALYSKEPFVPDCECIGLDCVKPWCKIWWGFFFAEFDAGVIVSMVEDFLFDPEEE